MYTNHVEDSRSSRTRRLLTAAVAITLFASLWIATPGALAKAPTGDFAVFSQCPRFTTGVNFCIYTQTLSGEVTVNKQAGPIKNTITLQGGIKRNEETEVETFVAALNGETLSKTPQNVPGGLLGLVNCEAITGEGLSEKIERAACKATFENKITGVTATTELARPASEIGISKNNLVNEEGTALSLPVKVHLENPFLGNECYIGSSSNPIVLQLTTGSTNPPAPNTAISGKLGKLKFGDEFTFVEITENTLVDNSFSAPEATGCGGLFAFLIDPIINAKIGLPSAAGKNTAVQNNKIREATAEGVVKSER